jgi:fatty-acyl-CoA synthase
VARGTLLELISSSLRKNAARTALVYEAQRVSYAELDHATARAAERLRSAGARPGDRVVLLLSNGLEYPIYDIAILRLGAAKVPCNDMLSAPDIAYVLEHCDARLLVVDEQLRQLAEAAVAATSGAPPIVLAESSTTLLGASEDTSMKDDCTDSVAPDDTAVVFYTGGTTGRPKAVVHTQRSLASNMLSTIIEAEIGRDDRLLLTTPLPHAAGMFTMATLVRGATAVITRRFDVEQALETIETHRITWTFLVPTMLYRILESGLTDRYDHSSLRTIQYGAAPIDPQRLTEAIETFGPAFIQLYGQTECPNFATTLTKQDHLDAATDPELLLSCGRSVMMAEVSVRGETGAALDAGEVGEVCIRSPYTMEGYLGDPGATAERFFDRWLRTGDLGTLDHDGYLFLKDRRSDMVISGGMNVYSAMVERVLAEAPGVERAAVIGVPDRDWGEAVHAIVTVSDTTIDGAEILAYCRDRLARYMRPKSIEIVEEIPLTPYGKMDKKALRAPHWQGRSRGIS